MIFNKNDYQSQLNVYLRSEEGTIEEDFHETLMLSPRIREAFFKIVDMNVQQDKLDIEKVTMKQAMKWVRENLGANKIQDLIAEGMIIKENINLGFKIYEYAYGDLKRNQISLVFYKPKEDLFKIYNLNDMYPYSFVLTEQTVRLMVSTLGNGRYDNGKKIPPFVKNLGYDIVLNNTLVGDRVSGDRILDVAYQGEDFITLAKMHRRKKEQTEFNSYTLYFYEIASVVNLCKNKVKGEKIEIEVATQNPLLDKDTKWLN